MIPSFCSQSIIRIRPLYVQERGSSVPNWNECYTEEISPVSVQPSASSVSLDGRVLGVSDSWTVYCNPDVDVRVGDKVIFEEKAYLVNEEPRKWQSPAGRVSSLQFTMIRWSN